MRAARRALPLLVAGAAALAAAAIVLGLELSGPSGESRPVSSTPVTAVTTISPRAHQFGDRIVAELEVAVDRDLVDPGTVRLLRTRFLPYQRVGSTEVTRTDVGRTTLLRYTFRLQCLERACLPGTSERQLDLPLTIVRYTRGSGRKAEGAIEQGAFSVAWPTTSVASRLTPADLARPQLRLGELPSVSYSVDPTLLAWLLAGLAALLVLAAGAPLTWWARAARPQPALAPASTGPDLSPLEQALASVERAGEEEKERRTALDSLARALGVAGLSALAAEATQLAWSRQVPGTGDMAELATSVHRALEEAA